MKLSVMIPAYNEKELIGNIIEKVMLLNIEKEIIVVDDFSTDGTRDVLRKIEGMDGVRVIYHERNMGKAGAVRTALEAASGEIAVIQDADLEYDPDDLPIMMKKILSEGYDAVYGSRFHDANIGKMSLRQYIGNKIMTMTLNMVMRKNLKDMETCYKMMRMEYAKRLDIKSKGFGIDPEITIKLLRMGAKLKEIPIRYYPRSYQEGKKIKIKDAVRTFYSILKFSVM